MAITDFSQISTAIVGDTSTVNMSLQDGQLKADVIPTGVDHSQLTSLNTPNYTHITSTDLTDLTDGGLTTLHSHSSLAASDGSPNPAVTVDSVGNVIIAGLTSGNFVEVSTNGLLIDSTTTKSQVTSAISNIHSRSHALDSTSDHTMGSLTDKYIPRVSGTKLVNSMLYESGSILFVSGNIWTKNTGNLILMNVIDSYSTPPTCEINFSTSFNSINAAAMGIIKAGKENTISGDRASFLELRTTRAASTYNYLRLTSSGDVGIGTQTPTKKLEVNGEVKISSISAATINTNKILVSDGGVLKYRTAAQIYQDISATSAAISAHTHSSLVASGTSTIALSVNDLGFVGIGTTTPTSMFTIGNEGAIDLYSTNVTHGVTTVLPTNVHARITNINSTSYAGGLVVTAIGPNVEDGGTGMIFDSYGDAYTPFIFRGYHVDGTGGKSVPDTSELFRLDNNNATALAVLGNGNVGIGTYAPTSKVHVIGEAENGAVGYFKNTHYGTADGIVVETTDPANSQFSIIQKWVNAGVEVASINATGNMYLSGWGRMFIVGSSPQLQVGTTFFVSDEGYSRFQYGNKFTVVQGSNIILLDTDVSGSNVGEIRQYGAAAQGGLQIKGYANDYVCGGDTFPLRLIGTFINGDPDNSTPAVSIAANKSTGSLANEETILSINNNTTPKVTVLGNGNVGIGTTAPTSKVHVIGDVEVGSSNYFYYGDPTTDGSWRSGRSGNNLVHQRRESGSWVTKQTISA